mmetsp:Transcript_16187/g.27813  ORF Transcript_16187/g.27813 Transcript_16187/m.27813 type:complete len:92 (-) Transcript_16187:489-764(-)
MEYRLCNTRRTHGFAKTHQQPPRSIHALCVAASELSSDWWLLTVEAHSYSCRRVFSLESVWNLPRTCLEPASEAAVVGSQGALIQDAIEQQ